MAWETELEAVSAVISVEMKSVYLLLKYETEPWNFDERNLRPTSMLQHYSRPTVMLGAMLPMVAGPAKRSSSRLGWR